MKGNEKPSRFADWTFENVVVTPPLTISVKQILDRWAVICDGEVAADFATEAEAQAWIHPQRKGRKT